MLEFSSCKNINPFKACVNDGADFLTEIFHESKCEYSAINTVRSVLSYILLNINGVSFGKKHLVQKLLKGVFKERPSLPRYTVTFEVKPVFEYIKGIA